MGDTGFDYSIYYSEWHDRSPEHFADMTRMHTAQLEPLLKGVPRGPALDVGCGMGFAVQALTDLGFDAEGVDQDKAQVAAAMQMGQAVARTDDVSGYLGNRPGRYSTITMLDLLEHLPASEHLATARAAWRALRPGGALVLTVPNAASPVAPFWRYNDWTHHAAFTVHSLRFVLLNAGFTDVWFQPSPVSRRPPLRLWSASKRQEMRRWLVRRAWAALLTVELGEVEAARQPLDLNLTCVAR